MRKYNKKKLALGGGMDQYNALDAVVGSPSPTSTSAIGAGLISKVPNSISASGPTMGTPTAKGSSGMSAGGYQAAASLGTGLMDAIDSPNQYGNQSSGVTIGKGALTGAAAGATFGSVVPGIGTVLGAAGGAVIGGVAGVINAKKIKRKERQLFADQNIARSKYDNAVSNALATDQGLVEGYKGASYFKMGGKILGRGLKYATGGPIGDTTLYNNNKNPILKKIEGGHNIDISVHDKPWVDSVLNANQDKNFVQRYQHPNQFPVIDNNTGNNTPFNNTNQNYSSHRMANSATRSYPTIFQMPNGKVENMGNGDKAWDYADSTKQFIDFKNSADADWFSSNGYKLGTQSNLPKYVTPNKGTMRTPSFTKLAFGGPIKGAPVHDLPPDNRRIRNIDSLATAWHVPTTSIATQGLYNYGDTKANGGIPRRMDYVGPNGNQFFDYYDDVTRGTTQYNTGSLPKFEDGGSLIKPSHRGKFTNWAKNHDMSVGEATSKVLGNKDDYSEEVKKMAQFSRNFGGHAMGGSLTRPNDQLLSGPSISSQLTQGGDAEPLNSQSTEIKGNSHAQGGVQIPQLGAEVENGETTTGNFVFSKELGFAKLHRPIAKAIGKIEKKPSTTDRRNALQLLKGQEERLALSQEQYKLQNGMQ